LEVDVQQVLILFLVEKWIPPSRLETAEIGKKKEGILGVNKSSVMVSYHVFFPSQKCILIGTQMLRNL
jgi:hypothetical protein